jgi:phage shock protein C
MPQRLTKSSTDRVIDGVAGGMAAYFGVDPVLVRLVFVLLLITSGGLLALVYVALMIVLPSDIEGAPAAPRAEAERAAAALEAAADGGAGSSTVAADAAAGGGPSALIGEPERRRQLGVVLVGLGVVLLAARWLEVDAGVLAAIGILVIGLRLLAR